MILISLESAHTVSNSIDDTMLLITALSPPNDTDSSNHGSQHGLADKW
jgi:hypothetical protein